MEQRSANMNEHPHFAVVEKLPCAATMRTAPGEQRIPLQGWLHTTLGFRRCEFMADMACRRLGGRVACVTGGSNGIGKAIVSRLVSEGAKVMFCDVDEAAGGELEAALSAVGSLKFVKVDVRNESEVRAFVEEAVSWGGVGGVDILVNNAAAFTFAGVEELTEELWEQVMQRSVHTTACLPACLPACSVFCDLGIHLRLLFLRYCR